MAQRRLSFAGSRKPYSRKQDLVTIRGTIDKVLVPAAPEAYSGWAVVQINNRTLSGSLPFLDLYFIYNLRCEVAQHKKYGKQYKIVSYGEPAFEPVAMNCLTLRSILQKRYNYHSWDALHMVNEVREPLGVATLTDTISLRRLATLRTIGWVDVLCQDMLVFKYEYLIDLSRLWPCRELSRLSLESLCSIAEDVALDPGKFCFHWRNDHGLPEVKASEIVKLQTVSKREINTQFQESVRAYNHINAWLNNRSRLSFTAEAFPPGFSDVAYSIKTQVFKPVFEPDASGGSRQYYLMDDWLALSVLRDSLNALLHSDAEPKLKKTQPPLSKLTPDQRAIYDAVLPENLLIVLGDAGTGKTLLGQYIFRRFPRKRVLPCACYGRVASNMRLKYGRGFTIAKVLAQIKRNTKLGRDIAEDTEVLIIDEVSTLTVRLLSNLLIVLKNVKKVVLLGDRKQMPPVERGAVLDALIRRYDGTPVVHYLTEILRLTETAEILRYNFNQIVQRSIELDFSTELDSDHPFVLLERRPAAGGAQADKLERITRDMRKLLKHYRHDAFQILTQKNEIRHLINRAMYGLLNDSGDAYAGGRFYVGEKVMFTENYYPKYEKLKHLRSSEVMNGEVEQIVDIYDVEPIEREDEPPHRYSVSVTDAPKTYEHYHRMLKFASGKQLNLRFFSIGNLTKGSASTVAMSQGSEYDVCVLYIHENVSHTFSRREFYTAVTRAKSRVIIFTGWGDSGLLENSDIDKILSTEYVEPVCYVHNWLPAYPALN